MPKSNEIHREKNNLQNDDQNQSFLILVCESKKKKDLAKDDVKIKRDGCDKILFCKALRSDFALAHASS